MDIEDRGQFLTYLRDTGRIEAEETPDLVVLHGGVSNKTVRVERASGEAWVVKQALEKLRVQSDWFSSPERIHREAEGLRWLSRLVPAGSVPAFVFEDAEHHLLAMAAVPEPHWNWKTLLLDGALESDQVRRFGALLGVIHREAFYRGDEVRPAFEDTSFFESLRIEPYYLHSAAQVPAAADFLERLVEHTRAERLTLVHGDYSPKNVLVVLDRIVLLDHEVIHWGDPAFDLGFALTHLLSKAHHLPDQRRVFLDAALDFRQAYLGALGAVPWGAELEARAVRHTLGCMLARVAGRSPLEYLDENEQEVQRDIVTGLMAACPSTLRHLVAAYGADLAHAYP